VGTIDRNFAILKINKSSKPGDIPNLIRIKESESQHLLKSPPLQPTCYTHPHLIRHHHLMLQFVAFEKTVFPWLGDIIWS
jgi:hypothetical protein